MKQLIIGKKKAYATGVDYNDLTKVPDGTIGIFTLADSKLVSEKVGLTGPFAVVCGRGDNKMPLHFPEVDVKTLTVQKAEYEEGATFTAKITVPTPEKGKDYTVIVVKKGTVFNERNTWSFNGFASNTTAADVAKQIVNQINANKYNLGVTANYSGGTITITAMEAGPDYEVLGADGLFGVAPTEVTNGKKAKLDKAYIQDLASRCAAGKGFNYLGEDGKEIYPGYPEVVDEEQYVLYTLRFAVPRVAAKQRDEVVYQIVHIAVPVGSDAITTLDAIFDTADSSKASKVNSEEASEEGTI